MIITKLKKKVTVDRESTVFTDKADALGEEYALITDKEKELGKSKKALVESIFKFVDKAPRIGKRQTTFGKRWEVGRLFRESDVLDSQRLKKLIGDKLWRDVTVLERKVDPVLLEQAIQDGRISVKLYAKCVSKKEAANASIYVKPIKRGKQ